MALAPIALLVGIIAGWCMGRASMRDALGAYQRAIEDEHRRRVELERGRGGPCWVRSQLPPGTPD